MTLTAGRVLPLLAHEQVTPPPHSATPIAAPLRIQLLGRFRVSVGSRLLEDTAWSLRRARSLVKLLALAPQHRMHREQIMDVLWPEMGPESAANNLHKTLYVARHILEPDLRHKGASSYIQLERELVVLVRPDSSRIDVEAFQSAAMDASLAQDPRRYEEALGLYTGDLLPDDRNEDWVLRPREQLIGLRLTLLLALADIQERRGAIGAAIEALQQVVAIDPVQEEAQARLMRLLARTGQRNLALRQFQHLVEALRRDLAADPDPGTRTLYQQILRGDVAPDSSAIADAAPPAVVEHATGVPVAERPGRSPLVGRDTEHRHLQERLDGLCAGHGGLLFIRGEAGAGKSRLCADLTADAAQRGVITLTGELPAQESQAAYRPIAMALEGYARGVAVGGPGAQLADMATRLAGLWNACLALLDTEQPATSPVGMDRERIFPAMVDFFKSLCAAAPVLVVLDDLHLAGEASLSLMRHLAVATRGLGLLLVCVYRTEEVNPDSPNGRLMRELAREGLADQLDMPRLDFEATAALVAGLLKGPADDAVLKRVYSLSGGNPYFTEEAVQALRGRGQIQSANGRWCLRIDTAILESSEQLRRRGNR